MISWILLLILLISCVCAGALVVKVSQPLYQAEENNNVTLEWKFTPEPDRSTNSLSIVCEQMTDQQDSKILYHLDEGNEVSGSQFSGRVQSDGDVLREGRLRLHVSRLRTEDSGLYMCEVMTEQGWGADKCRLTVTATVAQEPHTTTTVSPESKSLKGWHILLIAGAVMIKVIEIMVIAVVIILVIAVVILVVIVVIRQIKGAEIRAEIKSVIRAEIKSVIRVVIKSLTRVVIRALIIALIAAVIGAVKTAVITAVIGAVIGVVLIAVLIAAEMAEIRADIRVLKRTVTEAVTGAEERVLIRGLIRTVIRAVIGAVTGVVIGAVIAAVIGAVIGVVTGAVIGVVIKHYNNQL